MLALSLVKSVLNDGDVSCNSSIDDVMVVEALRTEARQEEDGVAADDDADANTTEDLHECFGTTNAFIERTLTSCDSIVNIETQRYDPNACLGDGDRRNNSDVTAPNTLLVPMQQYTRRDKSGTEWQWLTASLIVL